MGEIINYFGSKTEMAAALGVRPSAVTWWLYHGLPAKRAIQIEILTKGKFKAKTIKGAKYDS